MNETVKKSIQRLLPTIVFIIFLAPVITSSLLDLEQRKTDRIIWEQKEKIYLLGKFDQSDREDFVLVSPDYNIGGYPMYLRNETWEAFLDMAEKAEEDGVNLKIASATRNFYYQKNIWDNKWEGVTVVDGADLSKSIPDGKKRFEKILEYSAAPGASRHHWGTEVDINNANLAYFETKEGEKVYKWMVQNGPSFGFCQPYTLKGTTRPTGYNEEKWHWSYLPLSRAFTREYKELITDSDIKGFDGDEYVTQENLIDNYVLGINPACL